MRHTVSEQLDGAPVCRFYVLRRYLLRTVVMKAMIETGYFVDVRGDRRKVMRNHYYRYVFGEFREKVIQLALGCGVDTRKRLVQQKKRRIANEGSRNESVLFRSAVAPRRTDARWGDCAIL